MKILVFGGSFNPIHIGHLHLADEVVHQFKYDLVLFVPSNISVHKEAKEPLIPQQRLTMITLALKDPKFQLEGCEIERGGLSYSIETVRHLKEHYKPSGKMGFILGDDLIPGFKNWKEAETLSREVDLLVAHRRYKKNLFFDFPHKYCSNLLLAISSGDIRSRIFHNKPFRHLVPEKVGEYIMGQGLYGK